VTVGWLGAAQDRPPADALGFPAWLSWRSAGPGRNTADLSRNWLFLLLVGLGLVAATMVTVSAAPLLGWACCGVQSV
jgi:hypothetical protein